ASPGARRCTCSKSAAGFLANVGIGAHRKVFRDHIGEMAQCETGNYSTVIFAQQPSSETAGVGSSMALLAAFAVFCRELLAIEMAFSVKFPAVEGLATKRTTKLPPSRRCSPGFLEHGKGRKGGAVPEAASMRCWVR